MAKTRKQAPITDWEIKYIEKVNKELTKQGLDVNNLVRSIGSYNYDHLRNFFNNKEGRLDSRTIGKINKVLKLK